MAGVRISIPLRGTSKSASPLERVHEALAKISIAEVRLTFDHRSSLTHGSVEVAARPTNSR